MSSRQQSPADVERERLIESHLPLVKAVARRYTGRGAELDDLIQVGAVGLIKATDRFDPKRGVAFAAFAKPTIEGEIRHHLRDRTAPLRIPRELQRLTKELRHRQGELSAKLGRAPTVSELAGALTADKRDVERALAAERARDSVSISLGDDACEAADAAEPFADSDDRLLLAARMGALDERERRIIYLRFHADMTERQIAGEIGISQAHVSRLLAGALEKLREESVTADNQGRRGDITVKPVISPPSGRSSARDEAPPNDPSSARTGGDVPSGNRIEPVNGPREDLTVARYLDLPYHVMVRAERDRARSSWSATVEEFPGCSARGHTPDEAVEQLRPAMEAWLVAAIADEKEIPHPSRETSKPKLPPTYSGRFLVRMPSALHEQLAQAAEREHLSLNRLVTDALAASVSEDRSARPAAPEQAPPGAPGPGVGSKRPPARSLRVALAANLVVVVVAGLVAVALLVLALQRGI